MKRLIFLFFLFVTICNLGYAQYISEVLEYKPAPGQFINTSGWGLPSSASTLEGSLSGALSLGAFGGYVVFKFESPVENNENNPYGVDFVIYGNPLEDLTGTIPNNDVTWAEPGVVCVMKDENGNGEPDDTWYELAGSDYFFSTTIKNYEVTYTNPGGSTAADVPWADNQGNTGYVYANSYHSQAYYPLPENFSNVDSVSYTLSGTRMQDFVDRTNSSYITAAGRPWGYVDNNLRNSYTGLPDNPYTDNVEEGSGGDAFDISWAVDVDGNYVDLDEIDFIKVYTGVLADAGSLGEVSTEIRGAFDVAPDASITGWDSTFLTLNNIPIQVKVGETYDLEAVFTVKGRKKDVGEFIWSADTSIVSIDGNNQLTTTGTGTVTITATCTYNGVSYSNSMETTIIAPSSVKITLSSTEIRVNEKSLIEATVLSQNDDEISGLSIVWEASNSNVDFKEEGDSVYLVGVATGTSMVYAYPNDYSDIKDSVEVTILEAADSLNVYLTIKTDDGTCFPKSEITVSNFNLSSYVTKANHNYGLNDVPNVTLAHAVASVFDNVSFESDLRFKDTEDDGLYIYKLPVQSGSVVTYYYGYGNNGTSDSQTSCWMAKIGDDTYFKNFEDISIYEGEKITVYYIDNISQTWSLFSLTPSATTTYTGTPVTLQLTCDSLYLYSGTTVMTQSSNTAVSNEKILVDGETYTQNGETLVTDSNGEAQLTISEAGTYTIQAATEQFELTVTPKTAIQEQTLADVTIYPNPANQLVTIQAPNFFGETYVDVYSVSGNKIYCGVIKNSESNYSIDVSQWNDDIYLIKMIAGQASISRKIIVKH